MAERIEDRKMGIDDCSFLSKEISSYLEVDDPISSSYNLEVSSGGLSRPLTCLDDYSFFKDSKIKITLKEKFLISIWAFFFNIFDYIKKKPFRFHK